MPLVARIVYFYGAFKSLHAYEMMLWPCSGMASHPPRGHSLKVKHKLLTCGDNSQCCTLKGKIACNSYQKDFNERKTQSVLHHLNMF